MDKLINGDQVSAGFNTFSYVASIESADGANPYFCSGALVSPDVVLVPATSGCDNVVQGDLVKIGCLDLEVDCEAVEVSEVIENKTIFALVLNETSSKFPVRVISESFPQFAGDILTALSFGITDRANALDEDQYKNDQLFSTQLELTSSGSCQNAIGDISNILDFDLFKSDNGDVNLEENVLCMTFSDSDDKDDSGLCGVSDSGAPLVYNCGIFATDILVGLAITEFGCANEGIPQLFVNLNEAETQSFIREVTEDATIFAAFTEFGCLNANLDTPTAFPSLSDVWTCGGNSFASNDGCDCECGQVDPDCDSSALGKSCGSESPFCVLGLCSATTPAPTTDSPTETEISPTFSPISAPTVEKNDDDEELSDTALIVVSTMGAVVGTLLVVVVIFYLRSNRLS